MKRDQWRAWVLFLVFGPVACSPPEPEVPTIRVAAASDLQLALPVIATAFRQSQGVKVVLSFGASGQLAEQIRQGAPFDVFLSADRTFVDRLAKERYVIANSVQPYIRGSLVMAVDRLVTGKVETMHDLKGPKIKKIAIANPEIAPYGMAAKQALERSKLWDELQPKIVPAESVSQALQMVRTGNAEVAFVGRSLVDSRELEIIKVPTEAYDPIIQYLGIASNTEKPDDARAFTEFILGELGQGILLDLGFRGMKLPSTTEVPGKTNP